MQRDLILRHALLLAPFPPDLLSITRPGQNTPVCPGTVTTTVISPSQCIIAGSANGDGVKNLLGDRRTRKYTLPGPAEILCSAGSESNVLYVSSKRICTLEPPRLLETEALVLLFLLFLVLVCPHFIACVSDHPLRTLL